MNTCKILLLCLPLLGCNGYFEKTPPLPWAVVKKGEVMNAAQERVRKANPLPAALANVLEDRKNRNLLQRQISDVRKISVERCLAATPRGQDLRPNPNAGITTIRVPEGSLPPEFVGAMRCNKVADTDQLVLDLQGRLADLDSIDDQRRRFDQDLAKKAEQVISSATEGYALGNGYQLLITGDSPILFNKNKAVVDVTAGVVEYMNAH